MAKLKLTEGQIQFILDHFFSMTTASLQTEYCLDEVALR